MVFNRSFLPLSPLDSVRFSASGSTATGLPLLPVMNFRDVRAEEQANLPVSYAQALDNLVGQNQVFEKDVSPQEDVLDFDLEEILYEPEFPFVF